jgi:hypothetical protein
MTSQRQDDAMHVEVLVIPDCPHAQTTTAVVRRALDELGLTGTPVTTTVVTSHAQAEQLGFVGSPTVLIDGHDPFADPSLSPGLACRLYRDGTRLIGTPPILQVRQALLQAVTDRSQG